MLVRSKFRDLRRDFVRATHDNSIALLSEPDADAAVDGEAGAGDEVGGGAA